MDDARDLHRTCVKLFTDHPRQLNESYCQHLAYAGAAGLKLVGLGLVSLVHGLCPCLFEATVSAHLPDIHHNLRRRKPAPMAQVQTQAASVTSPKPMPISSSKAD
jgi:hypothetical protein